MKMDLPFYPVKESDGLLKRFIKNKIMSEGRKLEQGQGSTHTLPEQG